MSNGDKNKESELDVLTTYNFQQSALKGLSLQHLFTRYQQDYGVILQKIVSLSIINISSNPLVSKSLQSMPDEFHQAWMRKNVYLN